MKDPLFDLVRGNLEFPCVRVEETIPFLQRYRFLLSVKDMLPASISRISNSPTELFHF
jgi:hypothetical protein